MATSSPAELRPRRSHRAQSRRVSPAESECDQITVIVAVPLIERGQPRAHLAAGRGAKAGVKILGAAPVITGQAGGAGDVVGGSEAVVRAGALVPVADLAGQAQGGGVLDSSLLSLPGSQHDPADTVERLGLAGPVTALPQQGQRSPVAVGRLLIAALPLIGDSEVREQTGLTGPVTAQPEQGQRLLVASGRLLSPALPFVDGTEVGQCDGLTCPVTDLTGGCQCPPVAAGRLLVLRSPPLPRLPGPAHQPGRARWPSDGQARPALLPAR
jgi:hypothetical protein